MAWVKASIPNGVIPSTGVDEELSKAL